MRFALLFAVRLLVAAMVLAYVLTMLAAPCIPVADASGTVQAIPRWEYWLLHASVPSAIWWQWTGGLQPIAISDRFPLLLVAAIWMLCCLGTGQWIAKLDPLSDALSKNERMGVAALVGHAILATVVFLHSTFLGTPSLVGLAVAVCVLSAWQWRYRTKAQPVIQASTVSNDDSLSTSIGRRMVGLMVIANVFLACVHVFGATIPTQDMQVREVDWWIAKHASLDGKLRWSEDHMLANAPAGFNMPAILFASVLTCDLPRIASNPPTSLQKPERPEQSEQAEQWQRWEKWNSRLKTSVLAGKAVHAMLCLVGVWLVAVHLSRRWGILCGLFVALLLLSTPGLAELMRLGRTEALVAIWSVGLIVVFEAWKDSAQSHRPLGLLWGYLLAGALSSGYGSAILVGLPALFIGFVCSASRRIAPRQRNSSTLAASASDTFGTAIANERAGVQSLAFRAAFLGAVIAASSTYLRNTWADGDPIAPWGKVFVAHTLGTVNRDKAVDAWLYAYRTPNETAQESIDAFASEGNAGVSNPSLSPYRLGNLQDGVLRVVGNSNVHGLMLIPFALVGVLVGGLTKSRIPVLWALFWVMIWWLFSLRLDRDWVGSLFLLAWPAAIGTKWMAAFIRGTYMFGLVLIAMVWAVVVIPIWPTSDNRILVALDQIEIGSSTKGTGPADRSESPHGIVESVSYSRQFNESWMKTMPFEPRAKVLLIGETDDFDLMADCLSNGPFDEGWFDKAIGLSPEETGAMFRKQGITHLLVVWSGVRYRAKWTGQDNEDEYRKTIEGLRERSQLQSILWGIDASQAELFLVMRE